jgi:hypothetical protein
MSNKKYEVKRAIKIAKLAYFWCERQFGHPLKTEICEFKISQDKRVKDMMGEYMDRVMKIYILNCPSYTEVIKTVVHEYTHYLQMPKLNDNSKYCKLDDMYGYFDNPYEMDARDSEKKYYKTCRRFVYSKL